MHLNRFKAYQKYKQKFYNDTDTAKTSFTAFIYEIRL